MKIRFLALVLFIFILIARIFSADVYEHDVLQATYNLLIEEDMDILATSQLWGRNNGSVRVKPVNCSNEIAFIPFQIMIDATARRHVTGVKEQSTRIVYFDKVMRSQMKALLFLALIQQRVRYVLGFSNIYPSPHAILLSGPEECFEHLPANLIKIWRKTT